MTDAMITANNLSKTYPGRKPNQGLRGFLRTRPRKTAADDFAAVTDISFEIARGEMVGYVGPNGAGKSTTIKMLTGILVPSSGEATVAGMIPWEQRKQLAQRIGVVFGQRTQLWWDLALSESLGLLQHMYRVPKPRFEENLAAARELLDLDDFMDTPVRQLSLGQRMRGDLAASLLHDPTILYLDEPTIGLDIVAKARIREFLKEINRDRQVTVLLTTHDLDDIEQLCTRLMIIDHGTKMYDGSLDALRARFGGRRQLTIDFMDEPTEGLSSTANEAIDVVERNGPRVRLAFDREAITAPEVLALAGQYGSVRDMSIEEPDIEDVITGIYQGVNVT